MDAASAAIGVVSFGLEICQGLLKYYRSFKDSNQDVKAMYTSLDGFVRILIILEKRINEGKVNRTLGRDIIPVIEESIKSCREPIERLHKELDNVSAETKPYGVGAQVKALGKRLQYPFKESTLMKIKEIIGDARDELELALEILHIDTSSASLNKIDAIDQRLESLSLTTAATKLEQRKVHILDWLSQTDYGAQQSDFIRRRQPGTGQWLLDSPEFLAWQNGTYPILFCPGMPGAGKTILAAAVVDHLWRENHEQHIAVICLYLNYKRSEEQDSTNLIAAILKQLLQQLAGLPQAAADLFDLHKPRSTRPSLPELLGLISSVLDEFPLVYLVVDALDECSNHDGTRSILLSSIRSWQQNKPVRCLVTSRLIGDIMEAFKEERTLEVRASDADVERYLDGHVGLMSITIQKRPDIWALVKQTILQAIDGMFLLARLHLDSLSTKGTIREVKRALKDLPKGHEALKVAYDSAIERIESQPAAYVERAKKVISWISYAKRPLTGTELQHALAILPGEKDFDEDNFLDVHEMMSVCAGLVILDPDSNVVRLVHYTTQEYLQDKRVSWLPGAEIAMTLTCIAYLCLETWNGCPVTYAMWKRYSDSRPPFLEYAERNWFRHAREVEHLVQAELLDCSLNEMFRFRAMAQSFDWREEQKVWQSSSALHVAACSGLSLLLRELASTEKDPDPRDQRGRTPLMNACRHNNVTGVEILLDEFKADVDAIDNLGRTPLFFAIDAGSTIIIQTLISNGANINHENERWGNLICQAAKPRTLSRDPNSRAEIMDVLLQSGASVSVHHPLYGGQTALKLAFDCGCPLEFELLINNAAHSTDFQALMDQSLLELVYGFDDPPYEQQTDGPAFAMLSLLLERGANANSEGPYKFRRGRFKLLAKGGNTNKRDVSWGTALQAALMHDKRNVVKILRAAGATEPSENWIQSDLRRAREKIKLRKDSGC